MARFYEMFKEQVMDWFEELYPSEKHDVLSGAFGAEFEKKDIDGVTYDDIANMFDGYAWYKAIQVDKNDVDFDKMGFDMHDALVNVLTNANDETLNVKNGGYDFVDDFLEIVVGEMVGNTYEKAENFFESLQNGGCASGMIGALIYYADTRKLYIDHMESFDEYYEEIEEELGHIKWSGYRFNHVVWVVFEEFCYRMYYALFEED